MHTSKAILNILVVSHKVVFNRDGTECFLETEVDEPN